MNAVRVAIVGGGPRGLWAAEELMNLAWQRATAVEVAVFNAGGIAAYDPRQPDYWLMNVDASIVQTHTLGSFNVHTGNQETYPPRAQVGAYLAEAWANLPIPPGSTLVTRAEEIADPHALSSQFDFVLDVRGHAKTWDGALRGALRVYPHGSLDSVQPGSTVAIRGTALTFIDAALDLTLGRGGCFVAGSYERSGHEPAAIIPVSRSARFMNIKPTPEITPDLARLGALFGPRLARATTTFDISAVLRDCACQILDSEDTVTIDKVLAGSDWDPSGDAVAELRRSLRIARGQEPFDARAAVGMALRAVYPHLVERISFREEIPGFRELARRLEPVAFGPPSINGERILALIDAQIIQPPQQGEIPEADHVVDAVLAPPPQPPVRTDRDGFLPNSEQVAVIGRATELWVLGNDTLSRTQHQVIPRWARRVLAKASPEQVHGLPPLPARIEPWARELADDPQRAADLIAEFGSPANVLNSAPMLANVAELVSAGAEQGVDVRVFFARKANKALTFVDAVNIAGHGVDVASHRELAQVLAAGVPGERIILSAAIKSDELVQLAIDQGVTISVDNVTELRRIDELAHRPVRVAPRLAPDPHLMPPTRFGERRAVWEAALAANDLENIEVTGVHVHLHGYSARDRAEALGEVFQLIDQLTACGHVLDFVDLGGGVPMSYLDDAQAWQHFLTMRELAYRPDTSKGRIAGFTWKNDPLDPIYPYHQSPVRGPWLQDILNYDTGMETIAQGLKRRGLRLHLEPGRSLLDGCGMILARVEFVKTRSDGVPLVGLAMNRTQCRTTSADYTVDPILIPAGGPRTGEEVEGYLVGAYCIEDELILRRRIRFPHGVQTGDIIGIPNTAGYFMHILESASHQIPLANNVVYPACTLDRIDPPAT